MSAIQQQQQRGSREPSEHFSGHSLTLKGTSNLSVPKELLHGQFNGRRNRRPNQAKVPWWRRPLWTRHFATNDLETPRAAAASRTERCATVARASSLT
jgi:hypothetical protein